MFEADRPELIPRRATMGSAGYDFYAPHDIYLKPGEWTEFDTGVRLGDSSKAVCPMQGCDDFTRYTSQWVLLLMPRSGLGFKHGVRLRNTIGVIDMDYRDNIRCSMTADEPIVIEAGRAYMQGVIVPFGVMRDEQRPERTRDGGFGSTDRR